MGESLVSEADRAYSEAYALHRAGKALEAVEAYRQVLSIEPDHPLALTRLEYLERRLGLPRSQATTELGKRLQANLEALNESTHLSEDERSWFASYHTGVEELRRSPHMEFPRVIHIETLAVCNAACVFCPYPTMERAGEKMDDDVFEKILDDLAVIPADLPITVCPFKLSDPLLEKRLFKFMAQIWDRLPNAHIHLATNGSALNAGNIAKLSAAQGSLDLHVSLNDHRPAMYEASMKLPFDRTVACLDDLNAAVAAGLFRHPVTVTRVSGEPEVDQEFIAWCVVRFPALAVAVKAAGNWAGDVESRTHDRVLPVGCRSWFELSITATGDVALCCMDSGEVESLGNVREQNALSIYNGERHRRYRQAVSRRDLSPCSKCTYPETRPTTVAATPRRAD